MDELHELIRVLTTKRAKESMIFSNVEADDQRLQMFRLLKQQPELSDEEACALLYGDLKHKARFFATKSHLKNLLLSVVLRLEITQPTFTAQQEARYFCTTKYAQAEILVRYGARLNSIALFEQVLSKAREYGLVLYEVLSLNSIQHYYSITVHKARYSAYRKEREVAIQSWLAEVQAQQLREDLTAYSSRSSKAEDIENPYIQSLLAEMEKLRCLHPDSFRIGMHSYMMRVFVATSCTQYREIEPLCQEALAYLNKCPKYFVSGEFGYFAFKALSGTLCCREGEKSRYYAELCADLFQVKTLTGYNYFQIQASILAMHVHAGEYQRASEICNEVMSKQNFASCERGAFEMWQLIRALLVFAAISELGSIHPRTRAVLLKEFSLVDFLNSTPVYSTDKEGFNIVVQIVHVLYLLSQGNIEGVNSRAESLRQYRLAYVKEKKNPRAFILMKLLAALIKSDYDLPYIQSRYRTEIERLQTRDQNDICAYLEPMEFICYDVLWNHTVTVVEKLQSTNRLLRPRPRKRRGDTQ